MQAPFSASSVRVSPRAFRTSLTVLQIVLHAAASIEAAAGVVGSSISTVTLPVLGDADRNRLYAPWDLVGLEVFR